MRQNAVVGQFAEQFADCGNAPVLRRQARDGVFVRFRLRILERMRFCQSRHGIDIFVFPLRRRRDRLNLEGVPRNDKLPGRFFIERIDNIRQRDHGGFVKDDIVP